MMEHKAIRKELLGRSNEWIAERIAGVEQTNAALLEALLAIRNDEGRVCESYDTCSHLVCKSSYTAWAIADEAIRKAKGD
jgi:hypothetical protein